MTVEEVRQAVLWLEDHPSFEWEGIFTHFSTADQADTSYWETQHQRFKEVLTVLPYLPTYIHTGNSATSLWHKEAVGNMVRFGIAMYGLNPSGHALSEPFSLKPALSLVSELIQVKLLEKGAGLAMVKHISLHVRNGSAPCLSVMLTAGYEKCKASRS